MVTFNVALDVHTVKCPCPSLYVNIKRHICADVFSLNSANAVIHLKCLIVKKITVICHDSVINCQGQLYFICYHEWL